MIRRILFVFLLGVTAGGCAIGNTIDYEAQVPSLNIRTDKEIAVGVQDQRPYVRTGEKTAQFVGLQRGGFGNPFGVHTQSGDALADDFADTIVNALKKDGVKTRSVVIPSVLGDKEALDTLLKVDAGRYLLVQYAEWKSDSLMNTALTYNASAKVFDRDGQLLAQNSIEGRDNLGGEFFVPAEHAAKEVPIAYRAHLEELLGHEDIAKALQ